MNEQEAISKIKYRISTASEIVGKGENGNSFEDLEMAIKAMEEIQLYRAIEKRLADMFGGHLPLERYVDLLEEALEEPGKPHPVNARILTYEDADMWEAYKSIGTPERIKEELDRLRNDNECQGLYFTLEERQDLARKHRELEEYRAIGTVEECRAAVDDQRANGNSAWNKIHTTKKESL